VTQLALRTFLGAVACFGCSNSQRLPADPPTLASARSAEYDAKSKAQAGAPEVAAAASVLGAGNGGSSTSLGAPTSTRDAAVPLSGQLDPVPALRDRSGEPLPQTEERPSLDSPSFKRRIELLHAAIVKDEPQLATPAFFPVVAYEQVKDIAQPARDHKHRLLAAFAKNIRDYHRQLGKDPDKAKLIGLTPSTLAPRWMKPGTEGNRLGYYRLLRSTLKIADARGTTHDFEVTSMISWRGEWYVVHLNGFK